MSSNAIATVVQMLEGLPEATQNQIVQHLREFLAEIQDDIRWDQTFARTQDKLIAAARRAKQEITAGQAKPFDPDEL